MCNKMAYPTPEHEAAAETIVGHFSAQPDVQAVLLVGSCARGKASRDSCLDMAVLLPRDATHAQRAALERSWEEAYQDDPVFETLRKVGKYSHVDLDVIDGCFAPKPRGWTSGPDDFELEIGNTLVYSKPLWERGDHLRRLKARWLPYYGEDLRRERLSAVCLYCRNNLDHIPLFVERGLYFQAFRRLYDAFREFLQALFILRRTYPIAYDKWIREQIEGILGLPALYRELPTLLEIRHFESQEIALKGATLRGLVGEYVEE